MVEEPLRDLYPRHIVAVSGVVTDPRGRVLLVKGDRRGWEPPGGQVELEAGWFEVDEARRMVRAPQQSAKLEDAVAGVPEVLYRAYRTYPYEVSREGLTESLGA